MITLLLLLACGTVNDKRAQPEDSTLDDTSAEGEHSAEHTGETDDTGETAATDPLALAALVSQDELGASIEDLAGFGTRHLEGSNHDEVRAYLVERLETLGLSVTEHAFDADGVAAANVIAEIPGADPTRVWVFQAHFDSTSELAPEVAPGADDNASGVAAVLEAARLLREVPLSTSVWLVLTDAEEQGSLGSAALVEDLPGFGVEVQGVIAPDMIGYWPKEDGDAFDILGDEDSEWMIEDMAAVADALGVANKTWVNHRYCYGDDHTSWQEGGVPAISPMDCVEAHNVPGTDEGYGHYHRSTDLPDTVYLPFTAKVTGVIVASLASWAGVEG